MQSTTLRFLAAFTLVAAFCLAESWAQQSNRDLTKKKTKNQTSEDSGDAPWKKMPLLLDRPEKAYEVIGLVSAPQIFLWDDEESMKESLQKQAWKMKADAVVLDRVDTSFRFTGPAGGANGRAIRYKE
ncbi:MAG: hypothetical protein FJ411_04660 [Verrucomicrobia bacterium]|nr:hypothetical protein [Verrucomicrobiota bacterium]